MKSTNVVEVSIHAVSPALRAGAVVWAEAKTGNREKATAIAGRRRRMGSIVRVEGIWIMERRAFRSERGRGEGRPEGDENNSCKELKAENGDSSTLPVGDLVVG
jgi:hypothetical protein